MAVSVSTVEATEWIGAAMEVRAVIVYGNLYPLMLFADVRDTRNKLAIEALAGRLLANVRT